MAPQGYLKGKVAIITGASKMNGIGAATAFAMAEQGADVRFLRETLCPSSLTL
jgi:NAD(P)-dependent dehydrogenase (short-subunit alcohol dehydrogenase family)